MASSGLSYHSRPKGSTSEIRSTPRRSLRGQTFIPAQCKKMSRSNSGRCNLLLQPSLLPKRHNQRMAWQRLGRSSPDFSRDRPNFFLAKLYSVGKDAGQNMDRQSKRYFLRTSEGFEVDVTIEARGKYKRNERRKALKNPKKSKYYQSTRKIDFGRENTFGRPQKKIPPSKRTPARRYHRLKVATQPVFNLSH